MGLLEIARDFAVANWDNAIMWVIGGILIYLAIKKDMEPTLLLPMGFGAIIVNLPGSEIAEESEIIRNLCFSVRRRSSAFFSRSAWQPSAGSGRWNPLPLR